MHTEELKSRLQAIESRLELVLNWLSFMTQKENAIMATIEEVQAEVAAVADKVTTLLTTITTENDEVVATLKKLTDQIAAGTPVSSAQLDAVMGSLVSIGDRIGTATTNVAAFVPTPTNASQIPEPTPAV